MELNTKVADQVWVLYPFKDFQLICCLLDCFMVVRLESYLFEKEVSVFTNGH